jgi:hypothetical protein
MLLLSTVLLMRGVCGSCWPFAPASGLLSGNSARFSLGDLENNFGSGGFSVGDSGGSSSVPRCAAECWPDARAEETESQDTEVAIYRFRTCPLNYGERMAARGIALASITNACLHEAIQEEHAHDPDVPKRVHMSPLFRPKALPLTPVPSTGSNPCATGRMRPTRLSTAQAQIPYRPTSKEWSIGA